MRLIDWIMDHEWLRAHAWLLVVHIVCTLLLSLGAWMVHKLRIRIPKIVVPPRHPDRVTLAIRDKPVAEFKIVFKVDYPPRFKCAE